MAGSSAGAAATLHAAVTHQKLPGTLSMENNGILKWTPSSSSAAASATLKIDELTIMGLQVSAESSKQIVMVLQLAEGVKIVPEGKKGIFLYFNGGTAGGEDKNRALEDRNAFKNYLIDIVQQNKGREAAATDKNARASEAPAPKPASSTSATKNVKSAEGSRSNTGGTNTPVRKAPVAKSGPTELELRINVLKANPSLAILHKDVVMSKQISDQEFWSHPTRRALLNAERASAEQKQGRNARLADPRPTANEAGEMRINMTPELVRDLKAQHPVVARAFEENVPSKMDEATFWKRYFSSKLYHRLRTSARSQASQHTVQPDDILDKYIEEDDDGIEPRKEYNAHDAFLDLGATAEDHGETGNEKDWTMRAGVERRTLPLMRRFNDHSQSLLDSALGEQDEIARRKRRADAIESNPTEGDSDDGLVIDELQEEDQKKKRRLLDMREQRELFDGRGGERSLNGKAAKSTNGTAVKAVERLTDDQVRTLIKQTTDTWDTSLEHATDGRARDFSAAMQTMLANVQSRREARAWHKGNDVPETMLKALVAQNASTSEFLRQLWAIVAPQPVQDGSLPAESDVSTAQRKARAKRMFNSLTNSAHRFAELVERAEEMQTGLGTQRIAAAIDPVRSAIEEALNLPLSGRSAE